MSDRSTWKRKGYWTYENLKIEAEKFSSRKEFRDNNKWAYELALKNGIPDIVYGKYVAKKTKWTDEAIMLEMKKYNTPSDFIKNNKHAYDVSVKRGLITKRFVDFVHKNKLSDYTLDVLQEVANKYQTRSQFQRQDAKYYRAAHRKGILDEVCSHMIQSGNLYKRFVYVFLKDNNVYIGLTCNLTNRLNAHRRTKTMVEIFGEEFNFSIVSELMSAQDAAEQEKKLIEEYTTLNFNVINKAKGGALGGIHRKWTKELCHELALKYDSIKTMRQENEPLYTVIKRRKWLVDCTSHIKRKKNSFVK